MRLSAGLLLLAQLVAVQALAEARLSELEVNLEGRQVALTFQLLDGFSDELFESIQTGLPTGFVFEIELLRYHPRWWDRTLDSSSLQVVAMYNAVTQEYLVNYKQDGELTESRVIRDRDELERAMTRFQGVHLLSLGDLNPGRRYLLRARALLGGGTILAFIPSQETTDWVRSRRFRPPADLP